jgi:hypothetical protein
MLILNQPITIEGIAKTINGNLKVSKGNNELLQADLISSSLCSICYLLLWE